jgi:uncharacterized protein (TIGR03000 family)
VELEAFLIKPKPTKSQLEALLLSLLLEPAGSVDVSGTSRDQFGWYTNQGGVFTSSLVGVCNSHVFPTPGRVSWDQLLTAVSEQTSKNFKSLKGIALAAKLDAATAAQLKGQEDQRPQAFILDVVRDGRSLPAGQGGFGGIRGADNRATFAVHLPPDATLAVEGQIMKGSSSVRVFHSTELRAGQEFIYTFSATVSRGGEDLLVSRDVKFRAGEEVAITMDFSQATVVRRARVDGPSPVIATGRGASRRESEQSPPEPPGIIIDARRRTSNQGSTTFVVNLPAGATLAVDGKATDGTSDRRVVRSSDLPLGQRFVYTFTATVSRGNEDLIVSKDVAFRPGVEVEVNLTMDFSQATVVRRDTLRQLPVVVTDLADSKRVVNAAK